MHIGPEFISEKLKVWSEELGIRFLFIQSGKPWQNTFIKRKNGSIREELLDDYLNLYA
jgi:putative transposase